MRKSTIGASSSAGNNGRARLGAHWEGGLQASVRQLSSLLRFYCHFYIVRGALYAKAPHCCRRYKRPFTKTVRAKSLKRLHKLKNVMKFGSKVSVYSALIPEVRMARICGRVSTAPHFQTCFDFTTFE